MVERVCSFLEVKVDIVEFCTVGYVRERVKLDFEVLIWGIVNYGCSSPFPHL